MGLIVLPLQIPGGAWEKGFQLVRVSWFWDSVAAAGGLFHNLGSFASIGSSTHASQTGSVNSLPSATRDILDHLGEGFSSSMWYCYQFHCMVLWCKGVEQENWIPFTYGEKCSGPTPDAQKRRHKFLIALLDRWLPAGRMERHG